MDIFFDWSYNLSIIEHGSTYVKTIGAAKFKEQCLALLEQLDPEGWVVTKHGRPVARVLPFERRSAQLIGSLQDKIEIHGDILTTGTHWNPDAES